MKPNTADYPEYFGRYINQVPEDDILQAFQKQLPEVENFFKTVDEEKSKYAYAPGKWTLKEMWQHILDGERIFAYRALCIARKETVSLPSFEEDDYAANSNANARTWESITTEFLNLRRSTEDLFKSFTGEMLQQSGIANNKNINVLSLGFISLGHVYHHMKVAKERYF